MDSFASLSNAFQRLIALREIFLMPNLNPAGSNLNQSPLARLCVEKEESSLPLPLQVPSRIPGLPQALRLLIEMRAKPGLGSGRRRERSPPDAGLPLSGQALRRSTEGSRPRV